MPVFPPRSQPSMQHPGEETRDSSGSSTRIGSSADARIGSVLANRFELACLVGQGSYGQVYEARDLARPGESLALKLLRRVDAHGIYRFKSEFRALAEVEHENLVALHELVIDGGVAFFTMDLIRGDDFMSYVRPDGVLDAERLVRALHGLVRGVEALHVRGLVHRDLKPSNVLVDEGGRVVIVDFGLAMAFDQPGASATQMGFAGTPEYAAPEQISGRGAGPESDWFAVGTMLYQALCGALPHEPSSSRSLVAKGPVAPLQDVPDGLGALADVCGRLLAVEPDGRANGRILRDALGSEPAAVENPFVPPPFVGRQAELGVLAEQLARVEDGACACAFVRAASGLGKTSLVEHFLDGLRDGRRALILRGRCYVNEVVAYGAVDGLIDALSHHLVALPAAEAAAYTPRDARALAQLFPVLMRVPSFAAAPAIRSASLDEQVSTRERGLRALRELLARLSDRLPVVLFIDDLQWDDADSAWLLAGLVAEPNAPAVLLVGACRDSDTSHAIASIAADPGRAPNTQTLELSALDTHDAELLTRSAFTGEAPRPTLLRELAAESHGHPMFALELARWARGSTQARARVFSLDAAIRSRCDGLSGSARRLLEVVCVAGHRLKLTTALRVCGGEASSMRQLLSRRLVSAVGKGATAMVEPYHGRFRDALLHGIDGERERTLRRSLAAAIAREADPRLDHIVAHYQAADLPDEAAKYAVAAADQAGGILAFHRVPALIELALRYAEPGEQAALHVRLAQACALVSRARDASRAYERAAELTTDPDARWELLRQAMWQALVGSDVERGQRLLGVLDTALGGKGVRYTHLRGLAAFARMAWWELFGPPALRAPSATPDPKARRRLMLAWSTASGFAMTHLGLATYYLLVSFRLAARLGEASIYAPLYISASTSRALRLGRPSKRAQAAIDHALSLARTSGDPHAPAIAELAATVYHLFTAQPRAAARTIERLIETAFSPTDIGAFVRLGARLLAGPAFFWNGQLRRVREQAGAWIREARDHADPTLEQAFVAGTSYRHLVDDQPERAIADWASVADTNPGHAGFRDAVWGVTLGMYAGRFDVVDRAVALASGPFWYFAAYITYGRAYAAWLRGVVSAARAQAEGAKPGFALTRAIWSLRLERAEFVEGIREHLLAVKAFAGGRTERGLAHLARAQTVFERLDFRLASACASHALARLEPDPARAATHAAHASSLFEREGVRVPARMERAILPGLPGQFGA